MKSLKLDGRIDLSEANAAVKAIDLVRKKHKGQYLDDIAEICATEYKWCSNDTIHVLKMAKAKNLIKEVSYNKKISLCIVESTNYFNAHVESETSESESITDTIVTVMVLTVQLTSRTLQQKHAYMACNEQSFTLHIVINIEQFF